MSKSKGKVKCEIYSRVVGYLSPLYRWNKGKLSEWKERVTYDIPEYRRASEEEAKPVERPQPA